MTTTETRPLDPFESLDPVTGQVVGVHPVHDAAHVASVVADA